MILQDIPASAHQIVEQVRSRPTRQVIGDPAVRTRLGDAAWLAARDQFRWSDTARAFLDALRAGAMT